MICLTLWILTLTCVHAEYVIFYGGKQNNGSFGLSGGYSLCRSAAATKYPELNIPPEDVFPFMYGATELNSWDDNKLVLLPDGRPLYTGAEWRGRVTEVLYEPATTFSGCENPACTNCWLEALGVPKFLLDFTQVLTGMDGGDFIESVGNTCNQWTTTSGIFETLRYQSNNCGFIYVSQFCTNSADGVVQVLCLWDSPIIRTPTRSPTLSPTIPTPSPTLPTLAPTKSPTLSPVISPTKSPSSSPSTSPIVLINTQTDVTARKGSMYNVGFQLTPSMNKDSEALLALNVSLVVINNTVGQYVMLVDCSDSHEQLIPDTELRIPTIDNNGNAVDVVCLDYFDMSDKVGTDTFKYYLKWEGRPSNVANLSIKSLRPLIAPNVTVTTSQYPVNLSFALELGDTFNRTEALVGQVLSLPSHGKLRHLTNDSLVNTGDLVTGNLTYLPDIYYSNQYSNGSNVNFYGEPMDADTFMYRVIEAVNQTISDEGVMAIRVRNEYDKIQSISGITGTFVIVPGDTTLLGRRIQIIDRDHEEFLIGIFFSTLDGIISVDINQTELRVIGPNQHRLLLDECGSNLNAGCEEVFMAANPRYLNYLLGKLQFEAFGDLDSIGGSITCLVYQPGPEGITADNFYTIRNSHVPNITGKIELILVGAPTPPPTQMEEISLFKFITYFLYVCMIAACMVILTCVGGTCYGCYSGYIYVKNTFGSIRDFVRWIRYGDADDASDQSLEDDAEKAHLIGEGKRKIKKTNMKFSKTK